jgi:hypothetical protein
MSQSQPHETDIFKRFKKSESNQTTGTGGGERVRAWQEVKPSGVIDLSTHKNNIRIKPAPSLASASSGVEEEKSKTKCKFFPKCTKESTCPYYHPKEECKFFPNCSFGEKCLRIHPDVSGSLDEGVKNPS